MARLTVSVAFVAVLVAAGCRTAELSASERAAIAADIEREVKAAYNLKSPDPVKSFEKLYADSGRIVSASGGTIIASRDTLFTGIRAFWQYVGSNMRNPTWMWDRMMIDVLSRDAAVMTATYHVPHTTPAGRPHIIGGAWTAVFKRQGDRWVIVQEHLSDTPAAMADSAHAHMAHPPA
jgi:ketosteroid isomerase-like protein